MEFKKIDITKEASYKKVSPMSSMAISIETLDTIINLARVYNVRKFFEFGTWGGFSAVEFCRQIPAIVYTIDYKIYLHPIGPKDFKEEDLIRIIADSTKFDFTPYKEYFDMVFVDGGHDYNTVKSDTENGLLILKTDGIMAWHDYVPEANKSGYEVAKYIDEEIKPKFQLYKVDPSIIFLRKP